MKSAMKTIYWRLGLTTQNESINMEILTSIQVSGLKIHFGTEFVELGELVIVKVGGEGFNELGSRSGGELLGFFLLDFFQLDVLSRFLGNRAVLRQVSLLATIEAFSFPHELSLFVGLEGVGVNAFPSLEVSSCSSG